MNRRLIIVFAGGFGREILSMAWGIRNKDPDCEWDIGGFLDDREDALLGDDGTRLRALRILSRVDDYEPRKNDLFVCATGNPALKRKYGNSIREKGGEFLNLISPHALVTGTKAFGSGVVVGPFSVISCDVKIGNDTSITDHATIGHDVSIGEACHISAFSFIGGGARLGNEVTIHPHACVLPGVEVGDGATVGVGSVALKDVPDGETVFGVPGRTVYV